MRRVAALLSAVGGTGWTLPTTGLLTERTALPSADTVHAAPVSISPLASVRRGAPQHQAEYHPLTTHSLPCSTSTDGQSAVPSAPRAGVPEGTEVSGARLCGTVPESAQPPQDAGSVSFVELVMRSNPSATFDAVLAHWARTIEETAGSAAPGKSPLLSRLSLREVQLLNSKLHDERFDHPKRLSRAMPPEKAVELPTDAAQLLVLDAKNPSLFTHRVPTDAVATSTALCATEENNPVRGTREDGDEQSLFRYYSIAHFAAELNSTELLRFAEDSLPNGIPMVARRDQKLVCEGHEQWHSPLAPALGGSPWRDNDGVGDAVVYPSLEWVARYGADYAGCYLIHRAAMSNATDVLRVLVERFGEEEMFRLRRLPSAQTFPDWGPPTYQEGKNAVSCAVAAGATSTLAWVLSHYPRRMRLRPSELSAALIAAAIDDKAQTFEFFAEQRLFPSLTQESDDATATTTLADAVLLEGLPEVLERCACLAPLCAAAEAGSCSVIDWYIRVFGEEVLWVPDRQGATAIHHCARGGHTLLLRWILVERRATDCVNVFRHVDELDSRGRTPAMWCVLGGKKGKHVVDTLRLLECVGSQWRTQSNDRGESLADLAKLHHRPFTKVARFMRASQ